MTYDKLIDSDLRPTTSAVDKSPRENFTELTSTPTITKRHHQRSHSSFSVLTPCNDLKAAKLSSPSRNVQPRKKIHNEQFEETSFAQFFLTCLCYFVLEMFGHIREFLRRVGLENRHGARDNNSKDFAPLFQNFESFHIRNVYIRNRDCFNRPVASLPGAEIELLERKTDDYNWSFYDTGKKIKAINMGSYNYLGFAENDGPSSKAAIQAVNEYSAATCSSRQEFGTLRCHKTLESLMAKFLGVEACVTFGMGFATNALNIPALVDKGCLIMSDELNHASIILGSRLSGATIKVFKHNNPQDLEVKLKKAIIEGHPVTRRPWKKILIVVEGVYSMEGSIVRLPEIIAIKKKYKAYLYLDEAHSIGAVGSTGRGVVEHWNCDPRDVDILMGTFTKSFGAAGGYIAGTQHLVDFLKVNSHAHCYASSMGAPVCWQIIRTIEILMGLDGTNEGRARIKQLHLNAKYFRDKCVKMGFIVYGEPDSPVVPLLLYRVTKVAAFSRMMLERGIAVVVVGFPATVLAGDRVRFCISSAHNKELLDKALAALDECGQAIGVKLSRHNPPRTLAQVKQLELTDFNANRIQSEK